MPAVVAHGHIQITNDQGYHVATIYDYDIAERMINCMKAMSHIKYPGQFMNAIHLLLNLCENASIKNKIPSNIRKLVNTIVLMWDVVED